MAEKDLLRDDAPEVYTWFSAIATADWNVMRSLYDGGLHIDVSHPLRQTTALMEATRQGRTKVVEWLLHHGATPSFVAGVRATTARSSTGARLTGALDEQATNVAPAASTATRRQPTDRVPCMSVPL